MGIHVLSSGRVIQDVMRDDTGRVRFYEILDTRSNARRIYLGRAWDGRDRSQSFGPAASEADIPDLVEWFMEDEQTYWRWPRGAAFKDLIVLPGAFPWCVPEPGDVLLGTSGEEYTVEHVPEGGRHLPWNGCLLLNKDVPTGEVLRWSGEETRERCLIKFHADDGHPSSPIGGEEVESDQGWAYRRILQPTITYLLERQEPATIGPKPFGTDKELKPRIREQFPDPLRPQVTLTIWGHRMENDFRFRCVHPLSKVVTHLARWFKSFMRNNTPSLESNGVNKVLFRGMTTPRSRGRSGDDPALRDTVFYFRTEELTLEESSAVRSIDLNVEAGVGPNAAAVALNLAPEQGEGFEGLNPYTGTYDLSGNYNWGVLDIADYGTTGLLP